MLDLGLNGKVAIITGGSDGLGRAAAGKLAAEGAKVAICARRKEHLEQAADEIRKATGGQVLAHVADVSRAADCERLVDAVVAHLGGVDILLITAGTSAAAAFEKVDDDLWQADWDLKVMGAVRMSRLVIPHMKKRGGGRIGNITTGGGKGPQPPARPHPVAPAGGPHPAQGPPNQD